MILSIVDAIIVLIVIAGGLIGFKNGAIQEGVKFVGIIVVLILSFILKDNLMVLMYENLPFFDFFGFIRGISAINILFYQLLAFLVIFAALSFFLRVLLVITGLIEWLLKLTVFLRGISKIVGIFVGAIEYYVYAFIALYILSMPILNLSYVADSKFANVVLNNTPILSNLSDNTIKVYSDVWETIKNKDDKSTKEINTLVLATLLDNKLITVDSAKKLINSNKIIINDESILDNYNDGDNLYDTLKNKENSND